MAHVILVSAQVPFGPFALGFFGGDFLGLELGLGGSGMGTRDRQKDRQILGLAELRLCR